MSRLYGDKENIDSEEVKNFFSDRANRDLESDLSIVLFQDKENSEQRHIEEKKLFHEVGAKDKKLFIMEPVSRMGERLTLKDFYSEGLDADYSAIYRTEEEYMELFKGLNYNKIFADDIFDDLSDHSETHYKYYVIE